MVKQEIYIANPVDILSYQWYGELVAKYDSVRKVSRNLAVIAVKRSQPDLSLAEIGQLFSISKQRVSIILKKGR